MLRKNGVQPEWSLSYLEFPWLPKGWHHLKVEWFGDQLANLQPCSPQATRVTIKQPGHVHEKQLANVLSGKTPAKQLPMLYFDRSAWALAVLEHLKDVPLGSVITYKELATLAGNPQAARAVARVCASNRICLAIPCHRVIATNGKLGGFYWGIPLKKSILEWEKAQANHIRQA